LASPPTPHKTALITGASSGIGKALAYHFAQDGYQLVLAARGVARMQALADALQKQFKVDITVIGADLETNDGAAQLHADIKARGIVLSALVNNAGYGAFGEFKDSALAPELAMMQLNMNTVVVLTKLFMPDLLATRGKILNTASTAAFQPGPSGRHRRDRDGAVPRSDGFGLSGQGRPGQLGTGQGQEAAHLGRSGRTGLPRHAARTAGLHPWLHELGHGAKHVT